MKKLLLAGVAMLALCGIAHAQTNELRYQNLPAPTLPPGCLPVPDDLKQFDKLYEAGIYSVNPSTKCLFQNNIDTYRTILAQKAEQQKKIDETIDQQRQAMGLPPQPDVCKGKGAPLLVTDPCAIAREKEQQQARDAEQQRQATEAAYAATPEGHIWDGYRYYAFVTFCHDVRSGYMVQYINDDELQRAKVAIKAIVAKYTAVDPNINTDEVWSSALDSIKGKPVNQEWCQIVKNRLFSISPIALFTVQKP